MPVSAASSANNSPLRVGLVAGESSGDRLGAALMGKLRERLPDVEFVGVGGPRMRAAGCRLLADAEQLAVMGLVEVLAHLPRLWRLRRRLQVVPDDHVPAAADEGLPDLHRRQPVDVDVGDLLPSEEEGHEGALAAGVALDVLADVLGLSDADHDRQDRQDQDGHGDRRDDVVEAGLDAAGSARDLSSSDAVSASGCDDRPW